LVHEKELAVFKVTSATLSVIKHIWCY